MRKNIPIIVFITFYLFNTFLITITPVSAEPSVSMILEPDSRAELNVSPWATGADTVDFNVTCSTPSGQHVAVWLYAETSIGHVNIGGFQISFYRNETISKTLYLNVPLLTNASSEHFCIINGTWQQGNMTGEIDPIMVPIIILPFHWPRISFESEIKEVYKGESTTFNMRLNNSSNIRDIFRLNITNREDLESKGITINDIEDLELPIDGFANVDLKVKVSRDTQVGGSVIYLTVNSTLDENSEGADRILILRINEKFIDINFFMGPPGIILIAVLVVMVLVIFRTRKKDRNKGEM